MAQNKIGILYHAHCIDGYTAAWAAHTYYSQVMPSREIEMLPHNYGDPIVPVLALADSCEILHILDYSLDRLVLEQMAEVCSILLLDHHRTAFIQLTGKPPEEHDDEFYMEDSENLRIVLDNKYSGALLTWMYFNEDAAEEAPLLIKYVSDYDIWKFDWQDTKAVNMYLRVTPMTLAAWNTVAFDLDDADLHTIAVQEGEAILAYHNLVCKQIVETAGSCRIGRGGHKLGGMQVACPYAFTSEVGRQLADISGSYGAMWRQYGDKVTVSLRSNGDFNVQEIAASMGGGGGHKNAAGFRISASRWQECITHG